MSAWLAKSWAVEEDLSSLEEPAPFGNLDMKIAQSMTHVIRNMAKLHPYSKGDDLKSAAVLHAYNVEQELTAMVEEYALRHRFVSGRQMLSMVMRRFLCNDNSDIG